VVILHQITLCFLILLSIFPEGSVQKPELIVLEWISKGLVILVICSIASIFIYLVCTRKNLPGHRVFLLFGLLLMAFGVSYIIEIWIPRHNLYWLLRGIKALAACVILYAVLRLPGAINQALSDRKELEQALQKSEAKLSDIMNRATAAICCYRVYSNRDLGYEYCSAGTEELLGFSIEEIKTDKNFWRSRILSEDWDEIITPLYEDLFAERTRNVEYRFRHKDDSIRWILAICSSRRDNVADCWIVTSVCVDITSLKQAQIVLQQQAEREHLMAELTQRIRRFLSLEEVLNTAVAEVRQLLQADRALVYQVMANGTGAVISEAVANGIPRITDQPLPEEIFPQENYQLYYEGRIRTIADIERDEMAPCLVETLKQLGVRSKLALPILGQDKLWGLLIAHQCQSPRNWQQWEVDLLRQISEQLAIAIQQSELYQQLEGANRELQRLATLDGLTQIANRRCFDEFLDREWQRSRREQSPISLLLCDIDYFKLYNDYYGHQAGDRCLQQFAQTLDAVVKRSSDLVARYGGEEFAILLPDTDPTGAIQIAEQIQQAVAQLQIPHVRSSISRYITVSIGIACLSSAQELSPEDLIAIADLALYEVKANGRNSLKIGSHH
jgi:diguanylate cyclase (GGDEF)-like protein/PAS domain S-box-containing protein